MIIKAYNNQLRNSDLAIIAKTLQKGGIIIYPTDSVYAFACLPEQQNAIEKVETIFEEHPQTKCFADVLFLCSFVVVKICRNV